MYILIRDFDFVSGIGYKLLFVDEDATCVMPGSYSLQTASCTNLCYKKILSKQNSFSEITNIFENMLNIFK
jgi:hypothetical protein